MYQNNTDC